MWLWAKELATEQKSPATSHGHPSTETRKALRGLGWGPSQGPSGGLSVGMGTDLNSCKGKSVFKGGGIQNCQFLWYHNSTASNFKLRIHLATNSETSRTFNNHLLPHYLPWPLPCLEAINSTSPPVFRMASQHPDHPVFICTMLPQCWTRRSDFHTEEVWSENSVSDISQLSTWTHASFSHILTHPHFQGTWCAR